MSFLRRAGGQISLLVLSLIGAGISIYLILVHYNSEVPLACSTTGIINCENVLTSSYAYVPGTTIPISIPGLLWCLGGAALALAAWRGRRALYIAGLVWTSLGMLSVFYLVYVEIVRLGNICLWCTFLHIVILLMFLISVVQLQGPGTDDEYEEEEEEEEYSPVPDARKA